MLAKAKMMQLHHLILVIAPISAMVTGLEDQQDSIRMAGNEECNKQMAKCRFDVVRVLLKGQSDEKEAATCEHLHTRCQSAVSWCANSLGLCYELRGTTERGREGCRQSAKICLTNMTKKTGIGKLMVD